MEEREYSGTAHEAWKKEYSGTAPEAWKRESIQAQPLKHGSPEFMQLLHKFLILCGKEKST